MNNNLYTCIGKGGNYEHIGMAKGAGVLNGMPEIHVYRDTVDGQLYVRTPLDFQTRMIAKSTIEDMARLIYNAWPESSQYPWVEGGNSFKQQEARDLATKKIEDMYFANV